MTFRIRRRRDAVVLLHDGSSLDVAAFFTGSVRFTREPEAHLLCSLTGNAIAMDADDLTLLAGLTGEEWSDADAVAKHHDIGLDRIRTLVETGVLLAEPGFCDTSDHLLVQQERQTQIGWHPLAAAYQAHTAWSGVTGSEGEREHTDEAHRQRLAALVGGAGLPPPHFHAHEDALLQHHLPNEPLEDPFAQVLLARRTCRHFDTSSELSQADLGRVLRGTFGATGTAELAPGVVAVRRTSASGGALHPIEAYVLVVNVEGLAAGWYHYRGDCHALDLLRAVESSAAPSLVSDITIGQHYFAEAHAVAFHVARVDRHHWKYRNHPKALKALMMDAGHLSQTFYLLAAERGLGAFFTAAINDRDAAMELGLDPLKQIVLGANGLGVIDPSRDELDFMTTTFTPQGE